MHCDCCDTLLSDYECSIKHQMEGHYLNTCLKCLQGLGIPFVGNNTLSRKPISSEDVMVDDEDNNFDDLFYTNIDRFSNEMFNEDEE